MSTPNVPEPVDPYRRGHNADIRQRLDELDELTDGTSYQVTVRAGGGGLFGVDVAGLTDEQAELLIRSLP